MQLKPVSSFAVANPVAPQPNNPHVKPDNSWPGERTHPPSCVATLCPGILRKRVRARPNVSSPTLTAFAPKPATTTTPAASAAFISILSSPTPARAMIFNFGAAAMTSAVTLVRFRTTSAVASANAALSFSG